MPPQKRTASPLESPALRKSARLRTRQSTVRDAGGNAARGGQTYGIPTYDALFKHILGDSSNRNSFLHAFLSNAGITQSYRLGENMNPLQELQCLREFVHRQDTAKTVASISSDFIFSCPSRHKSHGPKLAKATDFLLEMVGHFEDIKKAFPKAKYNGTMDFVCKLDNGDFSLVEMQVLPKDYWDERALAYAALFYGRQISKGQSWPDIKKVYAINILGGGTRQHAHWADTPDQFMRHYKFQEQLHKESCERFIDGIELIQCSVMNAPDDLSSEHQERRDWITFFKRAALMNEDQVKSEIRTPAVLNAFKMARLSHLPKAVKSDYDAENERNNQVSQYTSARVAAGRAEGKAEGRAEGKAEGRAEGKAEGKAEALFEVARNMRLSKGMSNSEIASLLGLEECRVAAMKI
jgi:predicted transposase/invertase (TIGR01784 family)